MPTMLCRAVSLARLALLSTAFLVSPVHSVDGERMLGGWASTPRSTLRTITARRRGGVVAPPGQDAGPYAFIEASASTRTAEEPQEEGGGIAGEFSELYPRAGFSIPLPTWEPDYR